MTTSGEPVPRRGEVWWIRADKRRPALVVQTDLDDARIRSFLVVPLSSRLHLAGLAGNVRLERKDTGLPKPSVANVFDIQKVFRVDFESRAGHLTHAEMEDVEAGIRHVLGLL